MPEVLWIPITVFSLITGIVLAFASAALFGPSLAEHFREMLALRRERYRRDHGLGDPGSSDDALDLDGPPH